MADKPRFSSYKPLVKSPLFIRVVNKQANSSDIAEALAISTENEETREIAEQVAVESPDISLFIEDLAELLKDIIGNGVSPPVIQYLNSYMSSSLLMHETSASFESGGQRKVWLSIKGPDTPWVEAAVCFNLSVYLKGNGSDKIQLCSCGKFFVQGKMKYKFCSEPCKRRFDP